MHNVTPAYFEDLLINEYQNTISFWERSDRNKSKLIHDAGEVSDYIEATMSSLDITDKQILQNLALSLSKKIKGISTVSRPPWIDHQEGKEMCEVLVQL